MAGEEIMYIKRKYLAIIIGFIMPIIGILTSFASGAGNYTVKAVGIKQIAGYGITSDLEWLEYTINENGIRIANDDPIFDETNTIYVPIDDTKIAIGNAKKAAGLIPATDETMPVIDLIATVDGDRWPHVWPPEQAETPEQAENNISYPQWRHICRCNGKQSNCQANVRLTLESRNKTRSHYTFTSDKPCNHYITVNCGSSQKVIRVVFYQVDVSFGISQQKTCNAHELSPGAIIAYNYNWDCHIHYTEGGAPSEPGMYPPGYQIPATKIRDNITKKDGEIVWDYEYADSCNNEKDLVSVNISIKPNSMTGKFTIGYTSNLTLWEAPQKGQAMYRPPVMPGQSEGPWPPYEDIGEASEIGVIKSGRKYDLVKMGNNSLTVYAEGMQIASGRIQVIFKGSAKNFTSDSQPDSNIIHASASDQVNVNSVEMSAVQPQKRVIYGAGMPIQYSVDSISAGYNFDWFLGRGDDYHNNQSDSYKPPNSNGVVMKYRPEPSSATNIQLLETDANRRKVYDTTVTINCQNQFKSNEKCCGSTTLSLPIRVALMNYPPPKTILEKNTAQQRKDFLANWGAAYINGLSFVDPNVTELAVFQSMGITWNPTLPLPFTRVQYVNGDFYGIALAIDPNPFTHENFRICGIGISQTCFDDALSDSAFNVVLDHEILHCKHINWAKSQPMSIMYQIADSVTNWNEFVQCSEVETHFTDMTKADWKMLYTLLPYAKNYYDGVKVIAGDSEVIQEYLKDKYIRCPFLELKKSEYLSSIQLP